MAVRETPTCVARGSSLINIGLACKLQVQNNAHPEKVHFRRRLWLVPCGRPNKQGQRCSVQPLQIIFSPALFVIVSLQSATYFDPSHDWPQLVTAYWTTVCTGPTLSPIYSTRWIYFNALINETCCMPIERVDRPGESQEARAASCTGAIQCCSLQGLPSAPLCSKACPNGSFLWRYKLVMGSGGHVFDC